MDDTAQNNTPNITLTPDDLKKLTSQLSSEIDEEIRNQLSAQAQAQKTIDTKPPASSNKPETDNVIFNASPSPDPLRASMNSALSGLKEGDKVAEWTIKRIYSTNFGGNRSSFYELGNNNGAKWSLNQEEMRDFVSSSLKNQPPPDLYPNPETVEVNKTQNTATKKRETEKPLTKEQIDFFNKIHSDPTLWSAFTSLTKDNLTKVLELYEKGQLIDLGINADPLLDKLKNSGLGKEVTIKSGDNFNSLLTNAGHNLGFSSKDSTIVGLHVLANEKLIEETRNKAQAAGLTVEKLPESKELIELIKNGLAGNNTTYSKLVQFLNLLPTNSKFRVLSTDEIQDLEKYFTK